jgi:hypothetical protein
MFIIRQMNMLKERLKVGLVVILRDDVLGRPLNPPTATGGHPLAGGFDAQDDEPVLTGGEFVLGQQFAATTTAARLLLLLVGRRRVGHSERLDVAGRHLRYFQIHAKYPLVKKQIWKPVSKQRI